MDCIFPVIEKGAKCVNCGYEIKVDERVRFIRRCPTQKPELLGDRIESFLKSVNITPGNYGYAKAVLKLGGCNCGETKQMFNEVHTFAKEHGWIKALLHAKKIRDRIKADREQITPTG